MNVPKPTAAEQAADHLIEMLERMASDATRTAESQEAAAAGTNSYKRQIGYEEAADFHRALAALLPQVVATIRNGNLDHACPNCDGIDPVSCPFNTSRES